MPLSIEPNWPSQVMPLSIKPHLLQATPVSIKAHPCQEKRVNGGGGGQRQEKMNYDARISAT